MNKLLQKCFVFNRNNLFRFIKYFYAHFNIKILLGTNRCLLSVTDGIVEEIFRFFWMEKLSKIDKKKFLVTKKIWVGRETGNKELFFTPNEKSASIIDILHALF